VLLVSGDFVETGGMDMPNLALARRLAERGGPVHVVAHRVADDLAAHPSVRFRRIPKPAGSYALGAPLLAAAGRDRARRVAEAGGRVVVNGANCRWYDVSWVHYVHAAHVPRADGLVRSAWRALRHRLHTAEERSVLRRTRLIIANSRRTRDDLIGRLGVPAERVRVVYYGIDADRFRPADPARRAALRESLGWPADRPVVAFVGALGDRRKGFDTLFEAWRILCRDAGWDADLAVIGAGAELPAWRARAEEAGLSRDGGRAGRIRFLGFRRDVPDLLAAADALAAPTRYEAYGQGVREALCCGLPAIVSSDAGVAEHYPASLDDIRLPDPDDSADVASRLLRWRSDPAGRRALFAPLGEALRSRTWASMADEIIGLLEQE
jgi:glycosyltransferase involved in cell wall biosynthesis